MSFITISNETIEQEHLCCAIADKKHQAGVNAKRAWLKEQLSEGHVFRKLDERGKVFIEYAPLEKAWVPIEGDHYLYIYCLWVAGSFKGKGYGAGLLNSCLEDARQTGKSGICVVSSKKKKPYLSDKQFFAKNGFKTVDTIGADYELLALSLDGTVPRFTDSAKSLCIESNALTIYYSPQCPYILNCIEQVTAYCQQNNLPLNLIKVDTLEKAKSVPCVFNNWAVFYNGRFKTTQLLNEGQLKKLLNLPWKA